MTPFLPPFSTKPLDSVSELYYYGLRYYNPSTGRWLSRDPISERGGVNLYVFVGNEPIGSVDFMGLLTITLNVSFSPQLTREEKLNAHKELAKIKENLKECKKWGIDLGLDLSFVHKPGSVRGYPDFPKDDGNNLLFSSTKNLEEGVPGVTRDSSSIVDVSISKNSPGYNTASHEVAHQGKYNNTENPGPTVGPDGMLYSYPRDPRHSGDRSSLMFPKGSSVEGYADKVDKCWCEAMKRIAH